MTSVSMTERLRLTYPGFKVFWARLSDMDNRKPNQAVDALVASLPAVIARTENVLLARTEPMHRFFKQLNSNSRYHIRSLIKATTKGREYRGVNPAVDVLYTVELETGLLMSLHDLAHISGDLTIDVSETGDGIDHLSGGDRLQVAATDIVVRDASAVIAAVSLGISSSTCVRESSTDVILFAYGCPVDQEPYIADALDIAYRRMRETLSTSIVETGCLVA